MLVKEANLHQRDHISNNYVIIFDKMRIREDLVFDKHSETVVGFVNLGEVEGSLMHLRRLQA